MDDAIGAESEPFLRNRFDKNRSEVVIINNNVLYR